MTDEELNKKIHEWIGKSTQGIPSCKNCGAGEGLHHFTTNQCPSGGYDQTGLTPTSWEYTYFEVAPITDYCNDHNAVREFLDKTMDKDFVWVNTIECLAISRSGTRGCNEMQCGIVAGVMMTPRQLAEVGAKAVGIWEE